MLYVANNGETCRDQLCQHPECWQSNVRRVREAVRQRNGIRQEQNVNKQSGEIFDDKKRHLQEMESYSLPTLKIIDMTEDLITPYNSRDQVQVLDDHVEKDKHLHGSIGHQLTRPACQSSLRAQVPHTTPISPSLPEKHATRWKEKLESFNENCVDEKTTKINFHEIYDYNEMCQEWQDMFISTAYLVWCPSKKKRRKKVTRASSAVSENRKGFKNPIEDMLPLPPESSKKKPSTSSKVPTGGQPYSPCRSPVSRMYNIRPGDYISEGEYIMTLTKEDIPKSLIASKKIIEQKPHTARKDEQIFELKKSSSTKVLVDISATLTTPGEDKSLKVEEKNTVELGQLPSCERLDKRKARFLKQSSDFEPRKMLPLPSIAIPWGLIPERRRGHCKNSIPHCVDLDVMMEPVLYLPKTVSGSRSRVCTYMGGKEAWRERPSTGPTRETAEERNHLTSAYRLSPKNVGTPAPTPATPGARDNRRHRSDLRRTYTKDSLSRTRLEEVSETEQIVLVGSNSTQIPTVQSSRAQNDQAILEVAESNRETIESIGIELSKMSLNQNETNSSQKNIEAQSPGLDKVPDSESAMSDRAVSPSSRTNIPSDIWAELRSGGAFDHRRITPRSNLDIRNSDRPRSLLRGYHSSLGLSLYSYTGESNWKPHPPRLPKSFTYMGVYKPTILPKMPAALTVVPVPSVMRASHVTEPREVRVHLSKVRSIRIPPVPTGSPVPNIDIATASSTSIVGGSSTEVFRKTGNRSKESRSLESLNQEEMSVEKTSIPEQISQEKEYLISREIIHETGEEMPLDSEGLNVDTDVSSQEGHNGATLTVAEETLQDMVNSDKYTIEDTLRLLDALAGETDEFMDTLPNVTCSKSMVTCSKPELARTTSGTSTKDETTSLIMEEKRSKDEITCTKDQITSSKYETTGSNKEITCMEDKTTCPKDKITKSEEEITCTKDEITHFDSKATCTKDEITCPTDDSTCTKSEVTCEAREEKVTTRDTIVSIVMDESATKSITDLQNNEISEERTQSDTNNGSISIAKEHSRSPDKLNAQRSSHKSSPTRDMQGSYRSLIFPGEDVRPILSDTSFIPKVPSNFELTPFNMESELLLPIKIDSDLLLLNDDSFMDLEEDQMKDDGGSGEGDDDKTE